MAFPNHVEEQKSVQGDSQKHHSFGGVSVTLIWPTRATMTISRNAIPFDGVSQPCWIHQARYRRLVETPIFYGVWDAMMVWRFVRNKTEDFQAPPWIREYRDWLAGRVQFVERVTPCSKNFCVISRYPILITRKTRREKRNRRNAETSFPEWRFVQIDDGSSYKTQRWR